MEIFLADTEIFFKANPDRVGVVSDPIMLDKGFGPTAGGLLSTEIFGNTAKERSRKFGVIDLNGYYLQPYVYKVIKRLDKRIKLGMIKEVKRLKNSGFGNWSTFTFL